LLLDADYINISICYRTVIGLRGKDGVVFAVEKLVTSKLYEPGANRRIFNINKNAGMVSVLDIVDKNIRFCSRVLSYSRHIINFVWLSFVTRDLAIGRL
jgi:hypothetical protein